MSQIADSEVFLQGLPNSTRVSVFVGDYSRNRFPSGMIESAKMEKKHNQPRNEKIRRGEATEPQRCLQRFERKGLPLYSYSADGMFWPSILF